MNQDKEQSILSVKQDFLFKLLFGDTRNVDILANFLAAVLSIPREEFDKVELIDTAIKKEHEDDKFCVLDVNVKTKNGILINIEIQVIDKKDFAERTTFYTSRRLVEQLGSGDPYTKLTQTIAINIVDFDLFPYNKYHSTYMMREEEENVVLTDIMRIDFLELQKAKRMALDDTLDKHDEKLMWMRFINSESKEELDMLAQKNDIFKKPVAEVIRLSGDALVRHQYEERQKAIRDKIAELQLATEKGEVIGEARGKVTRDIETIRKKLAKDMLVDNIADMLELEESYVQEILNLIDKYKDIADSEIADLYIKQKI